MQLRPRVVIALAVLSLGVGAALWVPGRNDSASASTDPRAVQLLEEIRSGKHDALIAEIIERLCERLRDKSREPGDPSGSPSASPSPSPSKKPGPKPTASEEPEPKPTPSEKPKPAPTPTPTRTTEKPEPKPTPTATKTTEKPKPPKPAAWKAYVDYTAGQVVTYKGVEYKVLEAHTSLPGWEPDALPDLFEQLP